MNRQIIFIQALSHLEGLKVKSYVGRGGHLSLTIGILKRLRNALNRVQLLRRKLTLRPVLERRGFLV